MMRAAVLAILVLNAFGLSVEASQARTGGAAQIRACSLLPKDLVIKVATVDRRVIDMLPPTEEPLGTRGSSCDYGGITLQIDPFTPTRLDELFKERGKAWMTAPGIGDAAYLADNRGEYAELYARVGTHVFTIQMSIPSGGTAASIKDKVLTLAGAIAPRLR